MDSKLTRDGGARDPSPSGSPTAANEARVAPLPARPERSHWSNAWDYLRRDTFAIVGAATVLLLVIVAIGAPALSPHNPLTQYPDGLQGSYAAPIMSNAKFPLGTDSLGRDFLSRLLWGGRISITVAFVAVFVSVTLAIVVGGIAGYFGGWVDTVIMRFIDLMLSFPTLLLQIAIATVLPPSLYTVIVVIAVFGWVYPARVIRGQVLAMRERPFVEAARAIGAPEFRILFRHIVPQLWPIIIVFTTLQVPAAILSEAGLSFLGLGVRPPIPSWGNLIQEGFKFYRTAPWLILYPGLLIMLTVLGFNLLGDGLRDALDPRQWATRLMKKSRG